MTGEMEAVLSYELRGRVSVPTGSFNRDSKLGCPKNAVEVFITTQ